MSQGIVKKCFFCLFLPILWCLFLFLFGKGFRLSFDALHTYSPMIDTGVICDWHSDLFLFECICLKSVASFLGLACVNGIAVLHIASWCSYMVMLILSTVWIFRFTEQGRKFLFVLPLFYCLSQGFTFLPDMDMTLDIIVVAPAFLSFECAYRIKYCPYPIRRILFALVLVLALLHMVSFRKNSIIAALPLLYWIIPDVGIRLRRIFKAVIAGILSVILYLGSTLLVGSALHSVNGYPLIPMLASHICTTQAFSNQDYHNTIWEPASEKDILTQHVFFPELYFTYPYHLPEYVTDDTYNKRRQEAYRVLKEEVINVTLSNPKEAVVSKCLHAFFFFSSGYIPKFFADEIAICYPHMAYTLKSYQHHTRIARRVIVWRIMLIFIASCIAVGSYLRMQYRSKKSDLSDFLLLLSLYSVFYILSFAVVTPSIDFRYNHMANILSSLILPLFLLLLFDKTRKRIA